jgi:quinol monooxygenase YgiN
MRSLGGMLRAASFALALTLTLTTMAPSSAQVAADQVSFVVSYIEVAPSAAGQAARLVEDAANASRKEPGNLRYEILQRLGEPSHFAILEVWSDAKAFGQHAATASMKQFRDRLKPLQVGAYDERPSLGMAVGPIGAAGATGAAGVTGAAGTSGAVYVLTHVDIAGTNNRDAGTATLKKYAEDGRKEPNALRVEVWQQANRLNHYTVNEVWKDQAAYEAHVAAAPNRAYREKLDPMLGALYDARRYKALE